MTKTGPLFLGFDVGTQSVKALVIDAEQAKVVARASRPLSLLEGLGQGHMEQHPRDWLDAVVATCGEVLQQVDGAQSAEQHLALGGGVNARARHRRAVARRCIGRTPHRRNLGPMASV